MNAPEYRSLCRLVKGLRTGYVVARGVQNARASGVSEGLRAAVLDLVRWGKSNRPGAIKRRQSIKRRG